MISNMLGDVKKSPYQNRILAILDSVHQSGLKNALIKLGLKKENVIVWSKNGIEYYYPKSILTKIFGEFEELEINGDRIIANGIDYSKSELVNMVADKIDGSEKLPDEFREKFISKLDMLIY
jgi:signal recognition particle subunit SEC65